MKSISLFIFIVLCSVLFFSQNVYALDDEGVGSRIRKDCFCPWAWQEIEELILEETDPDKKRCYRNCEREYKVAKSNCKKIFIPKVRIACYSEALRHRTICRINCKL